MSHASRILTPIAVRTFLTVFAFAGAGGCEMVMQAHGVLPQVRMVNTGGQPSRFAGKTVEVAPVTGVGSSTTDKLGLQLEVRISSLSFHYLIMQTLQGSGLFGAVVQEGGGTPDYVLYADIVRQDLSGFTASIEVKYSLSEQSTGQNIWEGDILTDYTESPSSASVLLAGARAYKISALDFACDKNLTAMLARLSITRPAKP